MKLRMIAGALLMVIGTAAISTNAGAAPWRGCRGGFYVPRPVVRVCPPVVVAPPVVVTGGYYGGYARPAYHRCYDRGCYRGYEHERYERGYYRCR